MTYITIEKDKIEQVIQWAEKHGEIVFAGGGMDAVDSMNVFVESLRRSVAKAEKQEPVAWTPRIELHYKDGVLISQTIQYNPQGEKLPYPHEPKREWVGLTGQQKNLIARISVDVFDAIHRSAAKLKELNT